MDSKKRKLKRYTHEGGSQPVDENVRKLKLLVTVVNRNKAEYYTDLLTHYEVNLQAGMLARGTAGSDMLHLLGLEETDKRVIFSIIREDKAAQALAMLEDRFESVRGGKGIAFTVPLSSVIGASVYQFLSNNRMKFGG